MSVTHVHVSFCQVGCQFPGRSWELKLHLTTTQNGSLVPISFLYWCMCLSHVGSIPEAAYKGDIHKSSHIAAGSATRWLVWVQAYCGQLYNSSTEFCHDWFPRAQSITDHVIIRKFPANSRNIWESFLINGRLAR